MLFIRISLEMLMQADLEIKFFFFFFVISIKTFLLLENGVVSEVTFSEIIYSSGLHHLENQATFSAGKGQHWSLYQSQPLQFRRPQAHVILCRARYLHGICITQQCLSAELLWSIPEEYSRCYTID